ncbi:MAG TPA: hypothetical protein VGQ63_01685 [Pseudolabrys sp.]|jgi:hypothetical protein|nr:hypothetical protein [Pseudolabrys sp.]
MNFGNSTWILAAVACCLTPSPVAAAVCPTALLDGSRDLQLYSPGSAAEYFADSGIDLGFGDAREDGVSFLFYSFTGQLAAVTGGFNLASEANSNLQTCEQCILVREDIDGQHNPTLLFQTGGTLTIDPATPPGSDPIVLTWQNVTLAEVTVDNSTGISTFVPGGQCYRIVIDKVFADGFDSQ